MDWNLFDEPLEGEEVLVHGMNNWKKDELELVVGSLDAAGVFCFESSGACWIELDVVALVFDEAVEGLDGFACCWAVETGGDEFLFVLSGFLGGAKKLRSE